MRKLLLACICLLTFSLSANAQITHLPNTGCKNAGNTPISGAPKIGQTLNVSAVQLPCNSPGSFGFILFGICRNIGGLRFGCGQSNPCVMMFPFQIAALKGINANLRLPIPNDKKLIGAKFCLQGGCFHTFGGFCVFPLNKMAQVVVQA